MGMCSAKNIFSKCQDTVTAFMESEVDLAIVLPIFNPPKNWVCKLHESLLAVEHAFQTISIKIIIVNDGSTEDISEGIESLTKDFKSVYAVSYQQNRGKGFAIRAGFKAVVATYYIYTDWDFPFGEARLLDFYFKLEHADLVLAKRSKEYYQALPFERCFISKGLRFASFIFSPSLRKYDTQAGLKAFNQKAKKLLLSTCTDGFLFELEFVRYALRNKLRLLNVGVTLRSSISFSSFGTRTLQAEFNNFIKLFFGGRKSKDIVDL